MIDMEDIKTMFDERTSVRRYEREPISDHALNVIYSAILNTPTSYNGQQFSDLAMLVPESKYGSWGNLVLSFPIIGTGYWRKHDRHYYIGQ